MSLNWDDLVERTFVNPETGESFKVKLRVKDAILFELLKRIARALKNG